MESIPEVSEEFADFDDGTTVDGEEKVVEEVAPAVPTTMVVRSATGDKTGEHHRKLTWKVDHLLPRSAIVALGKDIQPTLAVVSLGHITANDLNSFATGFFNSVKRREVWVVLVDTRTPDAILAVQTGGGQLYLALVQNEHPALPAPATTTTGTMPLLPGAKWHKQLQHGVSPQLVEDFVAALQRLSLTWPEGHGSVFAPSSRGAGGGSGGFVGESGHMTLPAPSTGTGEQLQFGAIAPSDEDIAEDFKLLSLRPSGRGKSGGLGRNGQRKTVRFAGMEGIDPTFAQLSPDRQADSSHIRPDGPGSVFAPSSGGAHKFAATLGDTSAQLLDQTQAGGAQQSIGSILQTPLQSANGFSGGLGGRLPKPSHARDTRGGQGRNTQPASFEASTLIAPLRAGSVFGLGSSDGSPDELAEQGDDGEHRVISGVGDLFPVPEESCEEMSEGYASDVDISGDEDEDDASLALGADAQFFAPALTYPTGGGSVVERAGDEQPYHQPDDYGYSSADSEGSSTVENWFRDGSVSGDRYSSPVDYGRLEDDDPGVASPVGHLSSAFVQIGWSDRRGSSLVADLMADGSLQSCGACATDWERSQMDGFSRSHGLWEEGLTLVC